MTRRKNILLLLSIYFLCLAPAVMAQILSSSNLPILILTKKEAWQQIDSSWDGFELTVDLMVIDNGPGKRNNFSDPPTYRCDVSIKRQGSSSVAFPKKSYRITTLNAFGVGTDVSLLGLPAHEDWILKALYQDKSLLRDDLAFKVFREMGHYSSRSVFFELVVDGDYRGVYQLLEKIKRDKDRVNISKMKQSDITGDDVTGGYIISLDKFIPGVDKGWYSKYNASPRGDSANFFLYVYPKPDSIMPQQMTYIQNYVRQVEDVLMSPGYGNPLTGYARYMDVRSFADNFILTELSRNIDGYRASTFFHKDKQSISGGKLKAGPVWDFNLAFGNCVNNFGNDPYWWAYDQPANMNFIPFWWKRFMADSVFKNELRCRYKDLRTSVLSEPSLLQYIDNMASHLNEAQARNYQKYPILGQNVYPTPVISAATYQAEVGYLKDWLHKRLGWMDQQLAGTCIVSINSNDPASVQMQTFPNPFSDSFTFGYKAAEGAYVKAEMVSLNGSATKVLREGTEKEGIYSEEIRTEELPPGAYVLKLSINGDKYYQKLLKLNNK
jgi:hypothetical protein